MFSDYRQALDYLYANLPVFQRIGAAAYKPDLHNTIALLEILGNPEKKFKSVHIAGTNGKGSSSHMLASIFKCAGYKTGLYTSPHLKEFTERIRIDGREMEQPFVIDFVNRIRPAIEKIQPSFFEITVAMAFEYFALKKVDIAVIEVGLGGRLDATNVITPLVSLITNISFDHKDLLGNTLQKIAFEKAGIIKKGIPVVISETQSDTYAVFVEKARQQKSPVVFAGESVSARLDDDDLTVTHNGSAFSVKPFPLRGIYQEKNVPGVITTIELLNQHGLAIDQEAVISGLRDVVSATGLKGRWQTIARNPLTICDTGHNEAGIAQILQQIAREKFDKLFMIIGMVKDKDISGVLKQLPKGATYFFCEARIPRALPAADLAAQALSFGLNGTVIPDVNAAIEVARKNASPGDLVFVGGSTFVVAEIENL
ncbi:MAG TPA: folylpolyglutamate synthase/dihydrofolate synthase family protein [Cyclobacteriaceae bacterium]|nr:folylpolyglutamate synthase/dihydrofolate synthase family protein [Cyclobacteriaceae bacterium]